MLNFVSCYDLLHSILQVSMGWKGIHRGQFAPAKKARQSMDCLGTCCDVPMS